MKLSRYISLSGMLFCCLMADAYDCYLNADFSAGCMPEGFSIYDVDGLEQSSDNAVYGFSSHDSWIVGRFFGEDDYCACATSYFSIPGKASNWMVSDSFLVDSANASLVWTARSANASMPDGYSIYISEAGVLPEDFTGSPVFHIDQEDGEWTRRRLGLADYVGKRISVAFVHDSYDADRLCISDIFAGVPASAYLLCDMPGVVGSPDPLDVPVRVYTHNDAPIKGFSVELESGGRIVRKDFPDVTIVSGEEYPVIFNNAIIPAENESLDYSLRVFADGDSYEHDYSLTYLPVRVMCEELTGTWCGYCVCGIVELENMHRDYPDTFVSAAVHINDVMTDPGWTDRVSRYIGSGLPSMVMNHDPASSGHPRKIRDYYQSLVKNAPIASIYVESRFDANSRRVSADTRLKFAEDVADGSYRVEYGVIENDVCHADDSDYIQHNAYAGGENGEMAGWEDKPSLVAGVHFNDVARMYVDECEPLAMGIKSLEEIKHSVDFLLADNVDDPANAELIAFLVDGDDRVVNVVKTPLAGGFDGIEEKRSDGMSIIDREVYANGGEIMVYSADGAIVGTSRTGRLHLPEGNGIFIVRANGEVRKIAL